jgi:hypothetical protein
MLGTPEVISRELSPRARRRRGARVMATGGGGGRARRRGGGVGRARARACGAGGGAQAGGRDGARRGAAAEAAGAAAAAGRRLAAGEGAAPAPAGWGGPEGGRRRASASCYWRAVHALPEARRPNARALWLASMFGHTPHSRPSPTAFSVGLAGVAPPLRAHAGGGAAAARGGGGESYLRVHWVTVPQAVRARRVNRRRRSGGPPQPRGPRSCCARGAMGRGPRTRRRGSAACRHSR